MKSKLTYILILVLGLAVLPLAQAKEGGDQYPNGAENWFAGALPPPGLYFINFAGYYHGELRDSTGKRVVLPDGKTPSVTAEFDALRFVEVTPFKILGASYGMHVIVPIVNQSLDIGGAKRKAAVGDVIFAPVALGWHGKEWHAVASFDIMTPTGHYDKTDGRLSVGANYFGFEPLVAFSYMPKSKWEVSTKIMYNIKTTNNDTNYRSGDDFHVDYLAGKHLGSWMVGASGYIFKQVSDDKVADVVVAAVPGLWDAGRKGQALAVGPSVGYTNKKHMTFMVQWQHEGAVRNRFSGDKIWFKMIIPTASLASGKKG
jgi:hypothetical protein